MAVLSLRVNGVERTSLNRLRGGKLSLSEVVGGQAESSAGSVSLTVFRKISDGIPFQVRTRVLISASDERSQLKLRDPSPEGTRLTSVRSDLPYYSAEGELVFAISGGSHSVEFLSVGPVPLSELKITRLTSPWPREETWLWEENRDIRVASLHGGTPVDPSIVGTPSDWQGMPAFVVSPEASVSVQARETASSKRAESAVTLQRTLIKDVRGAGFTIADIIVGTLGGSGRLDLRTPAELGYLAADATPQLITTSPESHERGVEIRSETFKLLATSRMPWTGGPIPAVGWNRDVDWLKLSILSPPGQELLWIRGADSSTGTRFAAWNLSTVFIVLLISLVTGALVGVGPGIAAGICFTLIHGDDTSLMEVFFLAILALPIVRKESSDKRWISCYCLLLLFFVFQVYQYTVSDTLGRVFPDLTAPAAVSDVSFSRGVGGAGSSGGYSGGYDDTRIASPTETMLRYAEGSFGALIMAAAMFGAIIFAVARKFRWALIALGVALGSFTLRSMMNTFYSVESISSDGSSQIEVYNNLANERGLNLAPSSIMTPQGRKKEENLGVSIDAMVTDASAPPAEPVDRGQLTVQTGPGRPVWEGRAAIATWNGAVPKDLTVGLWYLPGWLGIALAVMKGLLEVYLIAILWRAIPEGARAWVKGLSRMLACLAISAFIPTTIASAQDTFPPSNLLEELRTRVADERALSRPCETDCVSTETAQVTIDGDSLTLRALVHSVGDNAWALPSSSQGGIFSSISIDGKPAEAARKLEGMVWLLVPNGVHSLEARGIVPRGDLLSLAFQQSVGKLTFETPDFKTLVDRSQNAPTAQLIRKTSPSSSVVDATRDTRIEPWFLVDRSVSLTHKGRTTISIARMGPLEREEALSLKLWPTERIIRGGEQQDGDTVLVRFKPHETEVSLEGIVNLESGALNLNAREGARYSEVWSIYCSELWRCEFEGSRPTERFMNARVAQIVRPRPGDSTILRFMRPEGAPGGTQSILMASVSLEPSTHFLKGETNLEIRAGQSGLQRVSLPEGAIARTFLVDGRELTYLLNTNSTVLEIPLQRGVHTYQIRWQAPRELSWIPRLPRIDVGAPFVNGIINYTAPPRWITLWTSSTSFGPRVTFWITLFTGLLGFLGLSYFVGIPCSRITATLLISGAWYMSVRAGLYMSVWLLICGITLSLSKRSEAPIRDWFASSKCRRMTYLLVFAPLSLIALWLQRAFQAGPDLGLRGVGTSSQTLRWYVDRGADSLPIPTVVLVPSWVWQVTLLLWSVFAAMMAIMIVRKILHSMGTRRSEGASS